MPQSEYRRRAGAHAVRWKATTPLLLTEAREPGVYGGRGPSGPLDVCLPRGHASDNVLPLARTSLPYFAVRDIAWHDGIGSGPSNHLLDSQVQCVNALEPLASDAEQLVRALGDVLPIAEPLEIEDGRFVAYEWIGTHDYLGEARGRPRHRGRLSTSADAVLRYRTIDDRIETALVEWKYTEDYRGLELSPESTPGVRRATYRRLVEAPNSPLRPNVLPYEDLFVEPFYQLMRQQLLASEMEKAGELGASRVRVVHVAPAGNDGFQASLNRPSHREVGATVLEAWQRLLRDPDRFVSVDSRRFCRADTSGSEYVDRYDHD